MSGANAGGDSLRFRPADTASLPMVEDEQSYRMGEVVVPNISEGLGLMPTGESNMVGDMHPEGPGAQGGLMVGDVILAVDDRVVTSVDWRPSAPTTMPADTVQVRPPASFRTAPVTRPWPSNSRSINDMS